MTDHSGNAFDKIRWIAATAVLLSHSFPLMGLPEPMVCGDSLGKLAVMVFFAVSGYLVCQSWDRDPNPLRFGQRRALRIMPGLVVATLVTTFVIGGIVTTLPLGAFVTDRSTWGYVASNALLVAGVERVPGAFENASPPIFNGSLWTLRYEVTMYAVLALGALAVRLRAACLALFVAGVVLLAWLSWRGVAFYTLPVPGLWKIGLQFDAVRLVKLGTAFFCAASLYVMRHRIALSWPVALLLMAALGAGTGSPLGPVLLALTVPYVTLVAAFRSPAALRSAWDNDLSYGIYVYAYPVQQMMSQVALAHGHRWIWAVSLSLLITLALAGLSWKLVEQPALPSRRATSFSPGPTTPYAACSSSLGCRSAYDEDPSGHLKQCFGHSSRARLSGPTSAGARAPSFGPAGCLIDMDSSPDLIERAQAGDEAAFRELVDAHRYELHLHCYRMLGSFHDAEDALQETLIAAWRGLSSFEGRSSLRTWLYRLATNRCLNLLRSDRVRAREETPMKPTELPRPTRLGEVLWIEPYPDALIDRVADRTPGPEAHYQTTEAVSLAFITALQLLPPRQRAVQILRDVLGFHAKEVAQMVDATEESVNSALKRARATLRQRAPASGTRNVAPRPNSPDELALVERFTRAFQAVDIEALVALLTEDVWISMPPIPFEWQGRERARDVLRAELEPGRQLVATRANGQPAFGLYLPDPRAPILHGVGLLVLTLAGDRISAITLFETGLLSQFGLPRTLPPRPA